MKNYQGLLDGILEGKTLDCLIFTASETLKTSVMLFDIFGNLVMGCECDNQRKSKMTDTGNIRIPSEEIAGCVEAMKIMKWNQLLEGGDLIPWFGYLGMISGSEETYFLGVGSRLELGDLPENVDVRALCSMFGIALKQKKKMERSFKKDQDMFLKRTMESGLSDSELETLCQMNDFPYKKKRSCAVISFDGINIDLKEKTTEVHQELSALFDQTLDNDLFSNFHTTYNHVMISFVFFPDEMANHEINEFCLDYYDEIIKKMNLLGVIVKVSLGKYYSGASTIKRGVIQAFQAMNFGKEIHTRKRVFSYGCEQLYHILSVGVDREGLQEIFDETIGVLEKYDKENKNNLTEVVKNLINSGFNLAETAKRMYIHRNTLLYKMEKIKELLGKDPREPKLYVRMILGLYARKILYPKTKRFAK